MAALGRILQVIGWIWVITGFAGPIAGFDAGGALPGVVLIFMARVLRTQASRNAPSETPVEPDEPTRVLNTERPAPSPLPPAKPPPPPRVYKTPAPVEKPQVSDDDALTRFLSGGDEPTNTATTAEPATTPVPQDLVDDKPKTSAELIAEARRRWDRRS